MPENSILITQESLSTLFSLYIRDAGLTEDNVDAGWLGRQGVALALHSSADVLRTKDLPVVMTFLISRALVRFARNILVLSLKKGHEKFDYNFFV